MEYNEIISAIRDYSELVEASSQQFEGDIISGSENTDGGFEEIICSYVDAVSEIKRIRNKNKRLCLVYDALGYLEYQIAETLRMSQSSVSQNIRWMKRFFKQ